MGTENIMSAVEEEKHKTAKFLCRLKRKCVPLNKKFSKTNNRLIFYVLEIKLPKHKKGRKVFDKKFTWQCQLFNNMYS